MKRIALMVGLALMLAGCSGHGEAEKTAHEQGAMADHSEHITVEPGTELSPAQQAYADVNARMHEGMAQIPEDADEAFMRGMLAHHRGAVEMSEVALEYGTDEQVRDLAQRIIDAQAEEIREMEEWLANRAE